MVLLYLLSVLLFLDLPRFIPAAMSGFGSGVFWLIVMGDLMFLRLPIALAGIWGVRDRPSKRLAAAPA